MNSTSVQQMASGLTPFILLAIFLVPCRAWCHAVARKVAVGTHRSRAALTGRVVRAMSWRIGLVVCGIVTLALVSAGGPADFSVQSLAPAAILCYPLILLSLWQIARRISKQVFQATSPKERASINGRQDEAPIATERNLTAAVSESAIRANRFRLTLVEGIVTVWLALTLVNLIVFYGPHLNSRKPKSPLFDGVLKAADAATNQPEAHPTFRTAKQALEQTKVGDTVTLSPEQAPLFFCTIHLEALFSPEGKAKAEKGDAQAQYEMGLAYTDGAGVANDDVEALKWYRRAAEQGYSPAQTAIGNCYFTGRGVTSNWLEAVQWYDKAAEQGCAAAQERLGYCCQFRYSNSVAAVQWYRKAADQGYAAAQSSLAFCYLNGEGVAKDTAEAIRWYRKAADQGNVEAQIELGLCYWLGAGVPKDFAEMVKWYRKAADQGFEPAQANLGISYADGEGVPKDFVEAYKWLNLASTQGWSAAKRKLAEIQQLMTPQQIADAQRQAREFKPHKPMARDSTSPRQGIEDLPPSRSATGFFITEDGFLITNEHVVKEAAQVRILTSTGVIPAKVVKVDSANDLALFKVSGRFSALPVATSRMVRLGNTVSSVGFPNIGLQGFAPKFARGEIAALSGPQDDTRYFQISVPVQPGNSGGALVDERGNVVGVVSAKLDAAVALKSSGALPENVNYAVKSSFLLSFLESVPEVSAKLKNPNSKEQKFEDVVKSAERAAVLVLVY